MVFLKITFKSFVISTLFLFLSSVLFADPPELTPKIVKNKVESVLEEHVRYHKMNEKLACRILAGFVEQLDPIKTYFIKSEVLKYVEPSKKLIEKIVRNYRKAEFFCF